MAQIIQFVISNQCSKKQIDGYSVRDLRRLSGYIFIKGVAAKENGAKFAGLTQSLQMVQSGIKVDADNRISPFLIYIRLRMRMGKL